MIERLAILGATGDLTGRYLLPALAALSAAGKLPDAFRLAAVGREDWDDEAFRNWAGAQLERHGNGLPLPREDDGAKPPRHAARQPRRRADLE